MTLRFDASTIESRVNSEIALQAMRDGFSAEALGAAKLPHRIDTPTGAGFIRVMPAVLDDMMGLKVMTLVEGLGNRYLVLLYGVRSGQLLAVFDADELTRIRTAAVTALAATYMCPEPLTSVAIIGTGFEAAGHIRCFAELFPLKQVVAYSPNAERCTNFAREMSAEIGIEVVATETSAEAMHSSSTVILATKAKKPVIDGNNFAPDTVVLSIGSTRLDLRELDNLTLARSAALVVDDAGAVLNESGDIADSIAAGDFSGDRMISLADLGSGHALPGIDGMRDIRSFKSVGTALQDLALARALYLDTAFRQTGVDIGELCSLKPFSHTASAKAAATA